MAKGLWLPDHHTYMSLFFHSKTMRINVELPPPPPFVTFVIVYILSIRFCRLWYVLPIRSKEHLYGQAIIVHQEDLDQNCNRIEVGALCKSLKLRHTNLIKQWAPFTEWTCILILRYQDTFCLNITCDPETVNSLDCETLKMLCK